MQSHIVGVDTISINHHQTRSNLNQQPTHHHQRIGVDVEATISFESLLFLFGSVTFVFVAWVSSASGVGDVVFLVVAVTDKSRQATCSARLCESSRDTSDILAPRQASFSIVGFYICRNKYNLVAESCRTQQKGHRTKNKKRGAKR